jgi:hypothetical protein
MTEHKFTDDEIIKALKCCSGILRCVDCPYTEVEECSKRNAIDTIDLINRQKAEIQAYDISLKFDATHYKVEIVQLKAKVAYWQDEAVNAKREAVKEFADRLKKYYASLNGKTAAGCVEYHVDQIAKEMIGETK